MMLDAFGFPYRSFTVGCNKGNFADIQKSARGRNNSAHSCDWKLCKGDTAERVRPLKKKTIFDESGSE
jgi:hypothetical protein